MTVTTETEAKLGAWAGFRLPDLTGVVDGAVAVPLPDRLLDATYYDTRDLRLARSGITLRYRTGDDGPDQGTWTVKFPDGSAGPALVRREVTFKAPGRVVPDEVARLVRATVRSALLAPVVGLRTRRRPVEVRGPDGRRWAEIVDDEVSVMEGARLSARFREVEVEVTDDVPGGLLEVVIDGLQEAGAGPCGSESKLARALGPRASAPPDVVVQELGPGATMAEVVTAAVASGTARLIAHDPGVRLGDDPEDVHQARVAVRRLRSDLRTFRSLLDEDATKELREKLRRLAAALGEVRDLDVLLERFRGQTAALAGLDATGVAGLLGEVTARREAARGRLMAVLNDDEYLAVLDELVAAAGAPPVRPGLSGPARDLLPRLVRRPWSHLRAAVEQLGQEPPVEALHEVRIRAKRCRYAAEAAAPVMGKPARLLAKAVAGLQEVLGDLNDAVVAEGWLREVGPQLPAPAALVAGELVAVQLEAIETGRRSWAKAWKAASAKPLRSWLG